MIIRKGQNGFSLSSVNNKPNEFRLQINSLMFLSFFMVEKYISFSLSLCGALVNACYFLIIKAVNCCMHNKCVVLRRNLTHFRIAELFD